MYKKFINNIGYKNMNRVNEHDQHVIYNMGNWAYGKHRLLRTWAYGQHGKWAIWPARDMVNIANKMGNIASTGFGEYGQHGL